jgi:hypothetical protein
MALEEERDTVGINITYLCLFGQQNCRDLTCHIWGNIWEWWNYMELHILNMV